MTSLATREFYHIATSTHGKLILLILLLSVLGYTASQNCDMHAECVPLMKEIPNCYEISIAMDCLRHLNRDCQFSQEVADALITEEYATKIVCGNNDLYSEYKVKSYCWRDLTFREKCVTPIALSDRDFKQSSDTKKSEKISELRALVEQCKRSPQTSEDCSSLQNTLLDLSLGAVISSATSTIAAHWILLVLIGMLN